MKLLKKLLSYIIAVTMVLSLATLLGGNVHAEENSIVINNARDGHVYEAYQIFSGDYSGDKLTNIKDGSGVNVRELIAALKTDEKFNTTANENSTNIFKDVKTAADVAKVLSDKVLSDQNYANDSEKVQEFAQVVSKHLLTTTTAKTSSEAATNKKATISGLTTGYYFVKDADTKEAVDVYTRFITKVVSGTVNVNLKAEVPSVEKKVQDQTGDKEDGADNDGYGNTADHEINESFKFKLTATIPANTDVASYKSAYKLVFHDTMSSGITYEGIDSVKLNGTASDGTPQEVTVTEGVADNQYSKNVQEAQAGGSWTLTIPDLRKFTELDFSNDVKVNVIYNAHLNANATVTKESGATNNENSVTLDYSNNPNAEAEGTTNNTPGNTVYVFTYGLDNTKVDKANTKTKLGGAQFTMKKGNTVVYFTKNANGEYVVDPNGKINTLESSGSSDDKTKGTFNIIGLDAGEYTLTETKAPDGYNLLSNPIKVKITATHNITTGTTATNNVDLSYTKTDDSTTGSSLTIGNSKGSTLPSTGGMGTTLLYVAGGILVACAAAYVVLNKKRA